MSKGNMLLGYARGKVGSLVFTRRKGEQVTRAYNARPNNPKSPKQILQRMKIYAPTALYRLFAPYFFKFAFDDQKVNETDYNVYMRKNIANSPWVDKNLATQYAVLPFPARLSDGALQSVQQFYGSFKTSGGANVWGVGFNFGENSTIDNATVAEFTRNIKNLYPGLVDGDMITFVIVEGEGLSVENGKVLYDGISAPQFRYAQVVLSESDDTALDVLGLTVGWSEVGANPDMVVMQGGTSTFESDTVWRGVATILTRKSGESVLSSPSTMQLNDFGLEVYNLMRTSAYAVIASQSYGVTSDIILDPSDNI